MTNDILVSGNIAYISDRYGGLKIVDVSSPVSPALLSHVPTTDARNVAVSNNMAYVADMTGGIKIIDVTNPQNPNQLSQVDLDEPGDVAVKNNIAYVADRPYGLSVVDVSNPNNPVVLHKAAPDAMPVATPIPITLRMTVMPSPVPDPRDIEISGNYLYMLQTISPVVRVIDISAPSSPVEVSSINTPGSLDIDILGNTFFASCYYTDMSVYDIGTPFVPVEYPELPDSQGRQMTIIGNYLFQTQNLADDFKGIQVIDISDPMLLWVKILVKFQDFRPVTLGVGPYL